MYAVFQILLKPIGFFFISLKYSFESIFSGLIQKSAFKKQVGQKITLLQEKGQDKCVACKLCEKSCPTEAIKIQAKPPEGPGGIPFAAGFELDLGKCISCGLCVEACPVDALALVPFSGRIFETREDLYLRKDQLTQEAVSDKRRENV